MRQTLSIPLPPRDPIRRHLRGCVAVLVLAAPVAAPAAAADSVPGEAQGTLASPAATFGVVTPLLAAGQAPAPAAARAGRPEPSAADAPPANAVSAPAEGAPEAARFPHGGVEDRVVAAAVSAIGVPRGKNINPAFVEEVFAEICRLGIREPQIVMRQAMLETGWLRAPFLMKRNNLFGFRYRSYLTFDDWKESVRYYRDWQARRYKDSDPSYYAFLTRIRYGAPNYLQHLRKIRWERECAPAPSPLLPASAEPAPAPAETLAHPDLPSRVEAVVPPPLGEAGAASVAPPPGEGLSLPPAAPLRAAP